MSASSSTVPGSVEICDVAIHEFSKPCKLVKSPLDISKWKQSCAFMDIKSFILLLNDSVKNMKCSDSYIVSQNIENLNNMLETFSQWIDEISPLDQPQRFGNKAFKTWFQKLEDNVEQSLLLVLSEKNSRAIVELSTYVTESFGNSIRIDYGTGHELAFLMFLCCLFKIGFLSIETDCTATILKVFVKYFNIVRKLQLTYRMEPAGSQGVWSLDDFQFLPFLFGSSQLIDHKQIQPSSFVDKDVYEEFANEYLFLSCIKYIHEVKTGPFAEHSNQLWNISGTANWRKVNSGLIKMYEAEVLSKFPIIQHVFFGSLLVLKPYKV